MIYLPEPFDYALLLSLLNYLSSLSIATLSISPSLREV